MKLKVNDLCCVCSYCYRTCTVDAPYYDGEQVQINNDKCISCGLCMDACPVGAIYDTENLPKPIEPHEPVTYDCDALIIGAGGSGMIAAVRIAEATGKKVIVLEKTKRTGAGAIHVAGPLRFFDTKWALDAGQKPTMEERIRQVNEHANGALNEKLVSNTMHAMPRFFDWLCEWDHPEEKFELSEERPGGPGGPPPNMMEESVQEGVAVDGVADMAGGPPPGGPGSFGGLIVDTKSLNPPSPAFHNPGEFIMDKLFARAKELGVTVLRETSADQLIIKDNKVTGVHATDKGGEVMVHCDCCLIATGSLLKSPLLDKVCPDYKDAYLPRYAHGIYCYTGDGAIMCENAGIPVDYENIWLNITGSLVMPCDALTVEYAEATGKQMLVPTDLRPHGCRAEALMVNQRGERWSNEQYANLTVEG